MALLIVTLGFFGDTLFSSSQVVLSHSLTDLARQFVYWRDFGFSQLKQGNLALWNPYIFSGAPYFGGFQSALLYPPNWFYLILPLSKAINFGIALHVFLAGLFMYLWTSQRGIHFAACLMSALLFMFCGAHSLHVYAGHLTNLCTLTWTPLLFLAIDGYFKKLSSAWVWVGVLAISMQILAGHPQYVFFTAVAAGIYTLLRLPQRGRWWQVLLGTSAMYTGAALLCAVQLLTGLQATSESVRAGGISYAMASMLSFPLENFVTLLAPGFLGDMISFPYWGRWYLWEMCLFMSVTGLVLAIYGALSGDRKTRCFSVTMVAVLLILALGSYSPLFKFLYHWIPGFGLFRSSSKFILLASLFALMLAAIGLDRLLRDKFSSWLSPVLLSFGLLTGLLGWWIHAAAGAGSQGLWARWVDRMGTSSEVYLNLAAYQNPSFVRDSGVFAAKSLFVCSFTLLLLSILFFLAHRWRRAVYLIALLSVLEVLWFAGTARATFDLELTRFPEVKGFLETQPGDYRVLFPGVPNMTMSLGENNLWGYDPSVLRRYAEFMHFTQDLNPDQASQYLKFTRVHRLYEILRCRYLFQPKDDQIEVQTIPNTLPRLQLVQEWIVLTDRDQILNTIGSPTFNPRKVVVLEQTPIPAPVSGEVQGIARVTESSTDHLVIEASLSAPSILLITDNYSRGWRGWALPGSVQHRYTVLPANYTFMAIPLSAGTHRIRLEYLPVAFQIGKWISIISLMICLAVAGRRVRSRVFPASVGGASTAVPQRPNNSPNQSLDAGGSAHG